MGDFSGFWDWATGKGDYLELCRVEQRGKGLQRKIQSIKATKKSKRKTKQTAKSVRTTTTTKTTTRQRFQ